MRKAGINAHPRRLAHPQETVLKAVSALVMATATFVPAAHARPTTPAVAPAAAASGADTGAHAAAAQEAAQEAATRWLALMDAGNSGEAWDAGAPVLQGAVNRATWLDVGKNVRAPLGAVKSRKQLSAVFTRTLPGAPEGEYVVIQYATDFASRAGVIETVAPQRQPDGSWKVTTYRFR
jgi:hypothetical protein